MRNRNNVIQDKTCSYVREARRKACRLASKTGKEPREVVSSDEILTGRYYFRGQARDPEIGNSKTGDTEKDDLEPAARGGDASPPSMILLTNVAVNRSSLHQQLWAKHAGGGQCCLAAVAGLEKGKRRRNETEAFIPWLRPVLVLVS